MIKILHRSCLHGVALAVFCMTAPLRVQAEAPLVAAAVAQEASTAEQMLVRAEAMLEAADSDYADSRLELAGRGYGLAQRLFRQLADEHPKWHAEHLQNRLSYCEQRIEKVVQRLLSDPPPVHPDPAPAPPVPEVRPAVRLADQAEMKQLDDQDLMSREIRSAQEDLEDISEVQTKIDSEEQPPPSTKPEKSKSNPLKSIVRPFSGLFGKRESSSGDGPDPTPPVKATVGEEPGDPRRSEVAVADTPEPAISQPPDAPSPAPVTIARADAQPQPEEPVEPEPVAAVPIQGDLIRVLLRAGEWEKAATLLLEGLSGAPDDGEMRLLLGIAYCQGGEYRKAMQIVKPLLRIDRTNARAHVVLGTAYLGDGNIIVAKDQMQLAIDLNPRLGEAHYNLARLWIAVEPPDVASARIHYEKALSLDQPKDPELEKLLR